MDEQSFLATLADGGYTEILPREFAPGHRFEPHSHPWDSRLLVLAGRMTIGRDGVEQVFEAGDVCEVPRDALHSEQYGEQGARLVVGRRHEFRTI